MNKKKSLRRVLRTYNEKYYQIIILNLLAYLLVLFSAVLSLIAEEFPEQI
jgi:hypothetical protein